MLQALVSAASRLLHDLNRSYLADRLPPRFVDETPAPSPRNYQPLRRVALTDGVGRTLFEEFAEHRRGVRGEEETGWVLLGMRDRDEAVVMATLPAGAERNAGVAHVHFNPDAQAVASRIVRQVDRRLTMLGVVHTHPGTLRHPSDGDFRGDSVWVGQLRGREGIFGIGTAEGKAPVGGVVAEHPKPHRHRWGELCLSWYALGEGERRYRPMPVDWTNGPDLARPLHLVWPTLEAHAAQLDRLYRQQANVRCEVVEGKDGPALAMTIGLAEAGQAVRVVVERKEVRYFWLRSDEILAVEGHAACIDQGVYLLLAELAAKW